MAGGGEVDGVGHARADGLRRRHRGVLSVAGKHDHELVAGGRDREPAVRERAPDRRGHLLDHPTPVQMPVRVHDALEAVEVDEH